MIFVTFELTKHVLNIMYFKRDDLKFKIHVATFLASILHVILILKFHLLQTTAEFN